MSKTEGLTEALKAGWCSAQSLAAANGWTNNTLRGAISALAKKTGLKVERERREGVTFYRLVMP